MKTAAALLCLICFSLPVSRTLAISLTGDSLNIGSGNDVTSHMTNGAAIGSGNSVTWDGSSTLLVGDQNQFFYSYGSLIAGYSNQGYADTLICIGWENELSGIYSLVGGGFNSSSVTNGIVFGLNNVIEGSQQFAFGRGLINQDWWDAAGIFLGQYNKYAPGDDGAPLLTIGNGTGSAANQRSNALEVYMNGNIKIPKRQGDIVMGEFGSGNGD